MAKKQASTLPNIAPAKPFKISVFVALTLCRKFAMQ